MTKFCKQCGETKSLDAFTKTPSMKDGHAAMCKPCKAQWNKDYWKTPRGRMSKTYTTHLSSSRVRGHAPPLYSSKELFAWALDNDLDALMQSWEASGYSKDLGPSVDRLDVYKGYSFDNIRLVTWEVNNDKAYTDRKTCVHVTKQNRKIRQNNLDGDFIKEFSSISAAARETKVCRTAINSVCQGTYTTKYVGGYVWEYVH